MSKDILVADDDLNVQELLKFALENQGYNVTQATTGKEVLDLLESKNFSLVILDIMMPNLDGFNALIKIRENPKISNIPIIVVTGKGRIKELFKIVNKGQPDKFIEKPFTVDEILKCVKELLP